VAEWCEREGEPEPISYALASFSPTVGACLGVGGRAVSEEWEGFLGMRFDCANSPLPDERTTSLIDVRKKGKVKANSACLKFL
jgi:hypothetical protein